MKSRAMVLCAGLGTRLGPLTAELPKPLVPVGDRPVLAAIADQLTAAGHGGAVINTHWMPEQFPILTSICNISLEAIHEPKIRGSAGGVWGARERLEPPAIVWNGDLVLSAPPLEALEAKIERGADLCLAVAEPRTATAGHRPAQSEPEPPAELKGNRPTLGSVGLSDRGEVVRLRGERFGRESMGADYVGLMALSEAALAALPPWGCLIGDLCLPWLRSGRPVHVVQTTGSWHDIGSPQGYLAANWEWLSARSSDAWVHPDASVAPGVSLRRCVVGAGARVSGSGLVRDSVLWADARLEAPARDIIATRKAAFFWRDIKPRVR